MSVSFNKTGVITVNAVSNTILTQLVNEDNNSLIDELGNYLVSDISWDEHGYAHGFIEGTDIMSVYENTVTTNEFIEY